ncbi:MAG: hypothetical protein V3S37_00300, partial [Dehalococcoidia bacterium]
NSISPSRCRAMALTLRSSVGMAAPVPRNVTLSIATPADFYDARSGNEARGQTVQPIRWQSAIAMINFQGKQMTDLKLNPVDLGFGRPRSQRGRPLLAEGEVAQEILERFQRLSEPFGTEIKIENGVGVVKVG